MSRKLIVALAAVLLAAFALTACGDDDSSSDSGSSEPETSAETTTTEESGQESSNGSSGGKGGTIEIEADPEELAYTTGSLETNAGEVTIEFTNPASIGHDVQIENSDGETVGGTDVITDDSATATVDLEPGTYTYYCSVPSHRPAGMEETLTVK